MLTDMNKPTVDNASKLSSKQIWKPLVAILKVVIEVYIVYMLFSSFLRVTLTFNLIPYLFHPVNFPVGENQSAWKKLGALGSSNSENVLTGNRTRKVKGERSDHCGTCENPVEHLKFVYTTEIKTHFICSDSFNN